MFCKVHTLQITVGIDADFATLIPNFTFPCLETLEVIAAGIKLKSLRLDAIVPCSNLTTLRLIHIDLSSNELHALFISAYKLTSLDILNDLGGLLVDDDSLVRDLTITQGESPHLPRLRDVRLYVKRSGRSPEADATRYAVLATSRYNWALSVVDESVRQHGIRPYPFRLSLKYEKEDKDMVLAIAEKIGRILYPVVFPELSDSFRNER